MQPARGAAGRMNADGVLAIANFCIFPIQRCNESFARQSLATAARAVSGLRSLRGRLLLDSQTSLDSLRALPWKRFEDVLAEAYRRRGYQVVETLGGGADGGVDLRLRKDGQVIVVQCKRWKGKPDTRCR